MITMYVTYEGKPGAWFDREYWLDTHFPLVRACWGPFGLEELSAFFPGQPGTEVVAIAACRFRDEEAMLAALAAPVSRVVMADVPRFTELVPQQRKAVPLRDAEASGG